jgi:hypothetical protein
MTMKKLLFAAMLCVAFNVNMHAQHNNIFSSHGGRTKYGPTLLGGGMLFITVGVLTPAETRYPSGNFMTGPGVTVPFYQQSSRFACMVTGVTLTFVGFITMIAERGR